MDQVPLPSDSVTATGYRAELLDIRVDESEPDMSRVSISGELDVSGVAILRRALEGLQPHAGATLEVDMSRVGFVDSTGVAPIFETRDRWTAARAGFVILNPSHAVRRLIEILEATGGEITAARRFSA
jgi:anti-anti-sigma factor